MSVKNAATYIKELAKQNSEVLSFALRDLFKSDDERSTFVQNLKNLSSKVCSNAPVKRKSTSGQRASGVPSDDYIFKNLVSNVVRGAVLTIARRLTMGTHAIFIYVQNRARPIVDMDDPS